MYEEKTYEEIIQSMTEQITSDINKTEGSFVRDMLGPCAFEISKAYSEFDKQLDIMFLDTSDGDYIIRRAAEYGIERKEGTKATGKVVFTVSQETLIPSGTLIQSAGGILYLTDEDITAKDTAEVMVTAKEMGSAYNLPVGALNILPISIAGVKTVTNTAATTGGSDMETIDSLTQRVLLRIREPATSGNAFDYKQWALSIDSVGAAQVKPLWNGPGTVKILITDNNMVPANETIIKQTQAYVESVRPIGATVTVAAPSVLTINIAATVARNGSKTMEQIRAAYKDQVETYLKSLIFLSSSISYAILGSLLLSVAGVLDYSTLQLNGGTGNVAIPDGTIAQLGTLTLTEAVG